MNRLLKFVAIGAVVLLGFTYAMYAYDYKGNYNLDVSVKVNVSADQTIALTEFTYSSSPTDVLQFWEQLRGRGGSGVADRYMVSFQLTQGTDTVSLAPFKLLVLPGESQVLEQSFKNVPAGESTLKITVRDAYGASLYEKSYTVVIG